MWLDSSSITVQAVTGGQTQTLYTSPTYAVTDVRAVTPTTLLFLIDNVPLAGQQADMSHNGWWKINTDGMGLTRLATSATSQSFRFNTYTQYPWSNVSRDGRLYAFESVASNGISLMSASLSGGAATEFASTASGSVPIVGWTTM